MEVRALVQGAGDDALAHLEHGEEPEQQGEGPARVVAGEVDPAARVDAAVVRLAPGDEDGNRDLRERTGTLLHLVRE